MPLRIRPRLTMALTAVMAAVAISSLTAAPASASNSYTGAAYIGGQGDYADDWTDEGVLSTSSNTNSNATCLWQKVLWSYGYLSWGDIDGVFGPGTKAATEQFQADWMGPSHVDGAAGMDTFTAASGYAPYSHGYGLADGEFWGSKHTFTLWRDGDGHYEFYDSSGATRVAGYNYLTCS